MGIARVMFSRDNIESVSNFLSQIKSFDMIQVAWDDETFFLQLR
jgi:hypothetical protein